MLRIEVDGTEVAIARSPGLVCSDEIAGLLGGRWAIVGNVAGFKILALVAAREQNMRASLLVGRMVFGPVLLCEVGNEIR